MDETNVLEDITVIFKPTPTIFADFGWKINQGFQFRTKARATLQKKLVGTASSTLRVDIFNTSISSKLPKLVFGSAKTELDAQQVCFGTSSGRLIQEE